MGDYRYDLLKCAFRPEMRGFWEGPAWGETPCLDIDCFTAEGTSHRPKTQCKLRYDTNCLHGLYLVRDRYVRCVHTGFQTPVYEDSCVEFFVQPRTDKGYFNFEFNCGGALLASYVTDPTRIDGRVVGTVPLSIEDAREVQIYHSLPSVLEPEIESEVTWSLEFAVPFTVLERYAGSLGKVNGQEWRGNMYKCGNNTSHPHWASWSPLSERNFHAPWDFGVLRFVS